MGQEARSLIKIFDTEHAGVLELLSNRSSLGR